MDGGDVLGRYCFTFISRINDCGEEKGDCERKGTRFLASETDGVFISEKKVR